MSDGTVHVTFVCSGNICRSPMAEKMLAHQIEGRGLAERVRVTSAGTGGWHAGDGADHRTNAVLLAHGYPTTHRAAQLDEDHLAADMGVPPDRLRMMRSFDPRSAAFTLDVEDPYYGGPDDFEAVFAVIEASLPGLHDWIDHQLGRHR